MGLDTITLILESINEGIDHPGIVEHTESLGSNPSDHKILVLESPDERIDSSWIADLAESHGSLHASLNAIRVPKSKDKIPYLFMIVEPTEFLAIIHRFLYLFVHRVRRFWNQVLDRLGICFRFKRRNVSPEPGISTLGIESNTLVNSRITFVVLALSIESSAFGKPGFKELRFC